MQKLTEEDYEAIEKLLELLEKYGEKYFMRGLCHFIRELDWHRIINRKEFNYYYHDLLSAIKPKTTVDGFWFKPGDLEVRINYLKGLLNEKTT